MFRELYNLRSMFYVKMNRACCRAYPVQNPQVTLLRYFGKLSGVTLRLVIMFQSSERHRICCGGPGHRSVLEIIRALPYAFCPV